MDSLPPVRRSALTDFCNKKGVPGNLRDAFGAYARSVCSDRYGLRHDTDTVRLLINHLNEEQLEKLWIQFISDVRHILPASQQSA